MASAANRVSCGDQAEQDPDEGYNPAVNSIAKRVKKKLNRCCPAQPLVPVSVPGAPVKVDGVFYELVADSLADADSARAAHPGRSVPNVVNVAQLRAKLSPQGESDWAERQFCHVAQLTVMAGERCLESANQGWRCIQRTSGRESAGSCTPAIVFRRALLWCGSTVRDECLRKQPKMAQSVEGVATVFRGFESKVLARCRQYSAHFLQLALATLGSSVVTLGSS